MVAADADADPDADPGAYPDAHPDADPDAHPDYDPDADLDPHADPRYKRKSKLLKSERSNVGEYSHDVEVVKTLDKVKKMEQ